MILSGFGETRCLHVTYLLPWRRKQQVALKGNSPLTVLHDVIIKMIYQNLTTCTVCRNRDVTAYSPPLLPCAYNKSYVVPHFTALLTRLLRQTVTEYFGLAIAQAVNRRLPTAAVRVRYQVRSCGIYRGYSGSVVGFIGVVLFPLPIIIPRDVVH
jgi:hypothetical protein